MPLTYVSYDEFVKDIRDFGNKIRGKYEAVCGIPRSGTLAASVLACHLHLPLMNIHQAFDTQMKVLVLDDSLYMGRAMLRTKGFFGADQGYSPHVSFGVVYGSPMTDGRNDLVTEIHKVIPMPRYFAWNLFHHPDLTRAALDIDGVLCHEPERPAHATDDDTHHEGAWHADEEIGSWYEDFVINAKPLYLPNKPVGCLITNRLHKFRQHTIRWMHKHDVRYDGLVMSMYNTADERRKAGDYGKYKGQFLSGSDLDFMIESSDSQARRIAEVSGKPVICTDTQKAYNP